MQTCSNKSKDVRKHCWPRQIYRCDQGFHICTIEATYSCAARSIWTAMEGESGWEMPNSTRLIEYDWRQVSTEAQTCERSVEFWWIRSKEQKCSQTFTGSDKSSQTNVSAMSSQSFAVEVRKEVLSVSIALVSTSSCSRPSSRANCWWVARPSSCVRFRESKDMASHPRQWRRSNLK